MKLGINGLRRIIREVLDEDEPYSERDELISVYSDVYKEKYGIRPRGIDWDDIPTGEIEKMYNDLHKQPDYYDDIPPPGYDEYDWSVPSDPPGMEGTVGVNEPPDPHEKLPKSLGMKARDIPHLHGGPARRRYYLRWGEQS